MDIKIKGISEEIMTQALEQARLGRLHILGKMEEVIPVPREELSKYAPRIIKITIPTDRILTLSVRVVKPFAASSIRPVSPLTSKTAETCSSAVPIRLPQMRQSPSSTV
jgi:hypothetical protein